MMNSTAAHAAHKTAIARPSWLTDQVWPFETFTLDVAGTAIAVTDVGAGPAILFVHTGLWSFIWRDVMRDLAADFRCVCLDMPGTGLSGSPGNGISLAGAACCVESVLEQLDLQDVTLVVHDLGGPAGVAGAGRVASRIARIVAVNAFAWRPTGIAFRGMLRLMGDPIVRELDAATDLAPAITATTFGVGRHMNAVSRRAFRRGIGRRGVRTFHRYLADARMCDALYGEVNVALDDTFAHLPLMTIFGEHNDPLGFQAQWRARFPDLRQVVIPGGHHFPMCDDPDRVARSIRSFTQRADRIGSSGAPRR